MKQYYFGYYVDTPKMDNDWVGNWEYLYFYRREDAELARQEIIADGFRVTEVMFG